MAQQQSEPRPESFGFMGEIQEHVPEEDREQQPRRPQGGPQKRTVSVSRRGRDNAPSASRQLDEMESDDTDGLDADDDLDASEDTSQDDADADTDDTLDADDADLDDTDDDANADADKGKGRKAPDKDSKTRAQWAAENAKLTGQLEQMQRQLDALSARNTQADDAQRQRQTQAGDDDLDEVLDDLFTADTDKDGFVKAGELEARSKKRKKLEKQIQGRVDGAVDAYATAEVKALWAIPEAREAWAQAQKSGIADKARKEHQHLGPLIFTIMREQHTAQMKAMEERYGKQINNLKQKLRQNNLDDIPAGRGTRGGRGTGSGNRRPVNPMERAMAGLSQKQGIPAPR